jgi:hypothetical protein
MANVYNPVVGELKSQIARALAAGVVGGLVAASVAAWGIVKNWPGLLGLVPTGAITAFPTPCGSNSGWADYKPATGRFIVGAGTAYSEDRKYHSWKQAQPDGTMVDQRLTPYGGLDVGGEETHVLTIRELPPHGHSVSTRRQPGIHDGLGGSGADYGLMPTLTLPHLLTVGLDRFTR